MFSNTLDCLEFFEKGIKFFFRLALLSCRWCYEVGRDVDNQSGSILLFPFIFLLSFPAGVVGGLLTALVGLIVCALVAASDGIKAGVNACIARRNAARELAQATKGHDIENPPVPTAPSTYTIVSKTLPLANIPLRIQIQAYDLSAIEKLLVEIPSLGNLFRSDAFTRIDIQPGRVASIVGNRQQSQEATSVLRNGVIPKSASTPNLNVRERVVPRKASF